jgi:PmbA protein
LTLLDIANDSIQQARAAGATDAECTIAEGEEFSAQVRLGEVETIKQAASRGMGLRILIGNNTGSSYTSDLSPEGVKQMVSQAIELAAVTTADPFAGLPDASEFGSISGDLKLYSADVAQLEASAKIDIARRAEAAALQFDPRITNSDGGSFDSHLGRRVFANSRGFSGEYSSSYCSISASAVAKQNDQMERDYWYHSARRFADLEQPDYIGRRAAERTLRRLGAVKVETQKVPIIFEPRVARSMMGHIFEAIEGRSVYRQSTFLANKLGEQVAGAGLTVVDDGTMPGLFGSQPFDDEGVPTRRTLVIEKGMLKSFLLNTYSARKLGLKTTGNASRGVTGNAGVGHGNFYLEAGTRTPEELIASIPNGFYVTELIGSGVNIATGDYSRGAAGLWIRNGELAYAVSEVTIAGTLQQMLMNMEAANDLEFRGSVAAPTLYIPEMTVGGR